MATLSTTESELPPRGNLLGFRKYFKQDFTSGFFVFLIALPLCLGISMASGFPPMAGVFTAIVGSILTTFLSNSELTIKGPAAGLIVIVLGCVEDFGGGKAGDLAGNLEAYRAALAVGVAAAILQIFFGVFRAGILGEFFPRSAIHGMLAAIGIIIIAKQIPVALGVTAKGEPLELLAEIPHFIMEANPAIAVIGTVSLLILFGWPRIRNRLGVMKSFPAQLIVLFIAVILGWFFDLMHKHSYVLQGHQYQLGEQFLVEMPRQMFGMLSEITFPNFNALLEVKAWYWVFMFFVIGTLESILSAKAIDTIDPWKRKTDMDRDIRAVGIANCCAAMIGGLPMISEIVRSKANIDNGARTRFADLWHGIWLLTCVALLPTTLHLIPKAALAAMLVYTGYRLAHPSEFVNVYRIGREQFMIFVITLIATLMTDLLVGVGIGIGVKIAIHIHNGVPIKSLFKLFLDVEQVDETTCLIRARESAVFSNWIPFKRQLEDLALVQRQNVILDVSQTQFIDHTFLEKLHEMQHEIQLEGLKLDIVGLENQIPLASHEQSARKRGMVRVRRITVVANESLEAQLTQNFVAMGATGYTVMKCHGAGRAASLSDAGLIATQLENQVRIETIVPVGVSDEILSYLRREVLPLGHVTAAVETVEAVVAEQFV